MLTTSSPLAQQQKSYAIKHLLENERNPHRTDRLICSFERAHAEKWKKGGKTPHLGRHDSPQHHQRLVHPTFLGLHVLDP